MAKLSKWALLVYSKDNLQIILYSAISLGLFSLIISFYYNFIPFQFVYLRSFVTAVILILFPGLSISGILFLNKPRQLDFLQLLLYSFCFGVAFWSIVGLAYFYLKLNLDTLILGSLILIFLGSILLKMFLLKNTQFNNCLIINNKFLSFLCTYILYLKIFLVINTEIFLIPNIFSKEWFLCRFIPG